MQPNEILFTYDYFSIFQLPPHSPPLAIIMWHTQDNILYHNKKHYKKDQTIYFIMVKDFDATGAKMNR